MRFLAQSLLILLVTGLPGCSTLLTQLDGGHDQEELYNGPYSGSVFDCSALWCAGRELRESSEPLRGKHYLLIALLPVDFVFDTLILPVTVFRIPGARPECAGVFLPAGWEQPDFER